MEELWQVLGGLVSVITLLILILNSGKHIGAVDKLTEFLSKRVANVEESVKDLDKDVEKLKRDVAVIKYSSKIDVE